MRVCINLRDQDFSNTKSIGIYNVAIGLTRALAEDERITKLILLINSSLTETFEELQANNKIEIVGCSEEAPRGWRRLLWDQWGLVREVRQLDVDWLILPKGFPPLLLWFKVKVCSYIHDNIFKCYAAMGWSGISIVEKCYFSWCYRRAVQKADLIVTNSQFTLDELISSGRKMLAKKVGIGFEPNVDLPTDAEERSGILVFISPHPHKLSKQSIAWLKRWKKQTGNRSKIYGVGCMPDNAHWPEGSDWEMTPRLSEAEMMGLWRKVKVLVYFSAYEGFGMPPCEAIRKGVIPLASDIPPHRENLSNEFLFSNDDYQSFASRLNDALENMKPPVDQLDTWQDVGNSMVSAMVKCRE